MDHDSDTVIFPSIPMDMLSEDLQRVLKKELTNHPDTRMLNIMSWPELSFLVAKAINKKLLSNHLLFD